MRKSLFIFFLMMFLPTFGQETPTIVQDSIKPLADMPNFDALDSLYREDQFYFAFTYNILQKRPDGVRQNKFSSGITFGFLRDMPFNKKRTWAIAAGLGYTINNFNQTLSMAKVAGDIEYGIVDSDISYDRNKLILNYIDLPIEIRWRTSTPESHKFWRIYTGFKLSYLVFDRYKYKDNTNKYSISNNGDLNEFQYGAYLAVGYNTWNLNVYYGLNPIFKSAELNGQSVDMHTLNVGLMFYIL